MLTSAASFRKVVNFHERWLRRALARPVWLAILSASSLIVASYVCYRFSGSDLLPEMDEGGFIVDYIMPAGSSLAETNRVISHVEQMLHEMPEVESTSRRTGLQLGLAAVTEANTGDISVKLKQKREPRHRGNHRRPSRQDQRKRAGARCRVHRKCCKI